MTDETDPADQAADAGSGPPPPPPPSRQPFSPLVRDGDLRLIAIIALFATLLLVLFGILLQLAGFFEIAPVRGTDAGGDPMRYFQDALDYREKRLTLALVLRSFLTGFSFIVGLALCTQGGVFILRQVTAFTKISANPGAAGAGLEDGAKTSPRLFSFESYSPGVIFLLGGVILMVATQHLSLPIKWSEIVLPDAKWLCLSEDEQQWVSCVAQSGTTTEDNQVTQSDICDLRDEQPEYCH